MKSFIISIIFLFICSFSNAQTDSTAQSLPHVIYKDVKDVVKSLAETLKVGTEHVYGVLIKQQIVNSVTYIILLFIGAFLLSFAFKQFQLIEINSYGDLEDKSIPRLIYAIAGVIIGGITFIFPLCNLDVIVTGFINPEYGAIKTIIEMLK